MDNLVKKNDEIIKYLTDEKFNIFYATDSNVEDYLPEIIWDNEKNWKNFFDVAKKESIQTIIIGKEIFNKEKLGEFESALMESTLPEPILNKFKELLNTLKENQDELGAFSFAWFKNGTKFSLIEKTKWFEEFEDGFSLIANESRTARSIEQPMVREDVLPPEISKKSENELAKEFLDYLLKEFPNPGRHEIYTAEHAFWEEKGVERYFGSKGRLLINKVSNIVSRKLEEREKEMIPKLIDECIRWAKDNDLNKLTKTNIIGFLSEKGIELSSNNKNILHTKVSLKLKS